MKQLYSIFFATLIALCMLPSCSEDFYNDYYYEPSLEEGLSFSFSPEVMTFYGNGGSITARLKTKMHWVVILHADWLSVSKSSGDGDAELTFSASPLAADEGERYTEIEIFISDGRNHRSYRRNVTQYPGATTLDMVVEDFQYGIPSNWQIHNIPSSTRSTIVYSTWEPSYIFGRSAARAYNNTSYTIVTNDCESWLISPPINNPDGDAYLSFESFAQQNGSQGDDADYEVYIMSDPNPMNGNMVQLSPTLPEPAKIVDGKWIYSELIRLDQMSGVIYIGFKYSPKALNCTEWYITNVRIGKIDAPDDPDSDNFWGFGTDDHPYNIRYVNSSTEDMTDVWVAGYVVGYVDGTSFDGGTVFSAGGNVNTNIILSDSWDDYSEICPVQLPAGFVRNDLNLRDNPWLIGEYIQVRCDISKYFGHRGIKNITEWKYAAHSSLSSRTKTRR